VEIDDNELGDDDDIYKHEEYLEVHETMDGIIALLAQNQESTSHSVGGLALQLRYKLPELQGVAQPAHPLGQGALRLQDIDFSPLVAIRSAHETSQAKHGIRKHCDAPEMPIVTGDDSDSEPDTDCLPKSSPNIPNASESAVFHLNSSSPPPRKQIIREFHRILRESQDHSEMSGLERKIRWEDPAKGSSEVSNSTFGNSKNAVHVRREYASKVRLL
jgi:hypothetical protein